MTEPDLDSSLSAVAQAQGKVGLGAQIRMFVGVVRSSAERPALVGLCAGLVVIVGATAYAQIALNAWNEPFYDAINRRDIPEFGRQLLVFAAIAGALLVLNVAQTWLNLMMKLKLRASVTHDLLTEWLKPRRAFLLGGAGEIGVNPDQRIHEDARHLTELSTDLGVGLFQAALLLACFIGVLWQLSEGVKFDLHGYRFAVPGYMVWCALFYAAVASIATWRVGRPLIRLNATRYARESDIRFALVHTNEHSEGVAAYRGEAEEQGRLERTFDTVLDVMRKLVTATTSLTWVVAGYGWFTIVAPVIVAAPAYFAGHLTFGGLLMAVGAFSQVQASLRWFVDNASQLADWRATLLRVGALRAALLDIDTIGTQASRIRYSTAEDENIRLDGLSVLTPTGSVSLSETNVVIAPGDRILVSGARSSGKTTLFHALAGLWPWGGGAIAMPRSDDVMFMPKRPFVPDGALRDVLAYPSPPDRFATEDYVDALRRMALDHLVVDLDRTARWDRDLTDAEQQSLAFARFLLHQPRWAIVDEAIDALPPEAQRNLFAALRDGLRETAFVVISGRAAASDFYARTLSLARNPAGRRLEHRRLANPDRHAKPHGGEPSAPLP